MDAPPAAANVFGTNAFGRASRPIQRMRAYISLESTTPASQFEHSSRTAIAMMQTADLRNRDHHSFKWMLDSTWHRSVAFQRKMRA